MKRLILLAGLTLALSLALGGSASAFASSLTLNSKASLSATRTSAVVSGTVICTAGNEAEITVIIQQSSGKLNAAAQGFATVTCSGQVQTWSATTDVAIGSAFKNGPAVALFSVRDLTDNTAAATQTQGIKLS